MLSIMETTAENILNVTLLEPRLKHATIFARFDELKDGESLTIHNDHDPRPLYFQLVNMRGETFTWQYLEQGPEWWKINITKQKIEKQSPLSKHPETGENILNVTLLEPRIKHATIFAMYDNLKEGESFIIHNDHDPKPLYYHLLGEHGDVFNWQYLENGPEWWKIRLQLRPLISKNEPTSEVSINAEDEVFNVTLLEPKKKHPSIFARFDALKAGESFTILNDHDPKPLYYQLLGERGDIFTWEYLEQGPEWWKVRMRKRIPGESTETLGEIAAKDLRKAEVFKKYGLDFCCGGKKTVQEACAEKGLDVTAVEHELQHADKAVAARPLPYNEWNLDFLADYIVNTHHTYVRKNLPDIRAYASKVLEVHGKAHPELEKIQPLVEAIAAELIAHMEKEEKVLFPYIKQLVQAKNNHQPNPQSSFGSIENPIKNMENEHEAVGNFVEEIRKFTKNFTLPEDACASYTLWYKMLEEFEEDLHLHIHLENNILFPKAIELEKV